VCAERLWGAQTQRSLAHPTSPPNACHPNYWPHSH
jgi:hypothetical protein